MKIIPLTTIFLTLAFALLCAAEEPAKEEAADHLARATLMINDGRYDAARNELSAFDQTGEGFDRAKFYTVKGVLDSETGNYEAAIESYKEAIKATEAKEFTAPEVQQEKKYLFSIGQEDVNNDAVPDYDGQAVKKDKLEKLYIYLSQTYYAIEDYANTVVSLDLAGSRGQDRAVLFTLRADCYWRIDDHHSAIQALNRGVELFPNDPSLLKVKSNYLAHLGLYRAAIESEKERMTLIEADESDHIMLSQLFIESKQINEAIEVLEIAMVKFPMSAKVRILLGHSYMEKDMNYTTAHLFKLGAYLDPKYLNDAVEMHRRVKDYPHAIFLNAQMTDKADNLRQKVAIYLDREEYEKIIGLRDGLDRYNLLEDDNMRYAFAYANYMAKDYEAAEAHLMMIKDPEIFDKGLKVLNNIEQCRNNSLECL